MNPDEIYMPNEVPDDVLAGLGQLQAFTMLLDEVARIAGRPATERVADAELLGHTALARKAGVGRSWIRQMLTSFVDGNEQKAREEAIQAAAASGVTARLWAKAATGVTYAPPDGWVVDELPPAGSGLYYLAWIDRTGSLIPVGPLVYPTAVDECGVIGIAGYDRWGQAIDADIALTDLSRPAKAQAVLTESGAWMDQPAAWCAWTHQILSTVDLRVKDPEPHGIDWQELADLLRGIAATAHGAQKVVSGHRVTPVPVALVERGLGRRVPAGERRKWAERGLIIRAADGRFAGLERVGGQPVRCLLIARDALDAALEAEAAAQ